MKSLQYVVSLVVCVCFAYGKFTDDKTENDIVVALRQEMADLIQHQDMEWSQTETALEEEMKQQEERYKDKIIQLKDHIKTLQGEVDRRAVSHMFSAYLTGGTYTPGPGSIIPFNQVDVNVGNKFDNNTHMFVCPTNGMYFFTFSLHGYMGVMGGDWSSGTLTVGGKAVCSAASSYDDVVHPDYEQSSASVITLCLAGDEVLVKASTPGVTVASSSELKQTTFAGFLLGSL